MRIRLVVFLMMTCMLVSFVPDKLEWARKMYAQAINDSDVADKMCQELSSPHVIQPVLVAYKASAEALVAKHSSNPYSKIKWLKESEKTFASAVKADPENVEIRFLRFSVQHYVPEWLGFSKDLEADKTVIIKNLSRQSHLIGIDATKTVLRFLLESGRCTEIESQIVKQMQTSI